MGALWGETMQRVVARGWARDARGLTGRTTDAVCETRSLVGPSAGPPQSFIDEMVVGRTGTLALPCGDGLATATFGTQVFRGELRAGQLELCVATTFTYDGCTWNSAQTRRGTLASGELVWSHDEAPAPGQGPACVDPCRASATVQVR